MTVCPGQRRPDSMGVKTYLQFSIFHFVVHGNGLSPEPACRFDFHFDFCTVVAICQLISFSTGHGDGTFSFFLGSFHRPIPVRCNWSVFARKMHSTSEFAKIVLSKCVIHAGFVTVPFQVGEWILDLISEFTVFNLVIRLSKVKQSFTFQVSLCRSLCWTTGRRVASILFQWVCLTVICRLQPRQPFFFP